MHIGISPTAVFGVISKPTHTHTPKLANKQEQERGEEERGRDETLREVHKSQGQSRVCHLRAGGATSQ